MRKTMRNDRKLKRYLADASSDMLLVAYDGAMRGAPLVRIARQLRDTALKYLAKPIYQSCIGSEKHTKEAYREVTRDSALGLLLGAYLVYLAFAKKARKVAFAHPDKDERNAFLYKLVKSEKVYDKAKHEIINGVSDVLSLGKRLELDTAFDSTIFFLVSNHSDCAKDHEEWQGRLYYNEGWRDLVEDDDLIDRVDKFIASKHMLSMQWVTEKPVFLITRPYCRHTYQRISAKEAMTYTEAELLARHHMNYDTGRREENQTLGAEKFVREKYQERLDCLRKLYKAHPSEEMARDIEKTELLLERHSQSVV